ncbi:sel1 repeat family protein [Thiotrichales bacterium 19S3-7]|nr:sel1 repeat family protein [Thiotrichales bacterium 19S3-7]MCF6802257.1 sel1 repeat family protein [Thiotrichales bacterium 19S3-11]
MTRLFIICITFFCISSLSYSMNKEDYIHTYNCSINLAKKGDTNAQYNLGYLYEHGLGVKGNYQKAIYWYRTSIKGGNNTALFNLARMYEHGLGVREDHQKAFQLYLKSAKLGYANSQLLLGSMYFLGKGINKNYEKAYFWYEKAAHQNNILAQRNLGLLYLDGIGVKKDDQKAKHWLELAYKNGDVESKRIYESDKKIKSYGKYIGYFVAGLLVVSYILLLIFLFRLGRSIKDKRLKNWFVWLSLVPVISIIFYLLFIFKLRSVLKSICLDKDTTCFKQIKSFNQYIIIHLCFMISLAISTWLFIFVDGISPNSRYLAIVLLSVHCFFYLVVLILTVIVIVKSIRLRREILKIGARQSK